MSAGAGLSRYSELVDDVDAFLEAAARPLPRVVWPHPLRGDAQAVRDRVLERCAEARPTPWDPGLLRLPATAKPGKWPEFALGLLHVQEEISVWPARVLAPLPGERVLDLCAAPGNKTAHLALAMGDRGVVVANEPLLPRHAALSEIVVRLGLTCVVTTAHDGRHFPGEPGSYDRVMADVPCSCEGTSRKMRGKTRHNPIESRFRMARLQQRLLRRALELVRPGGVVVYSTCTYAPEENEGVLDSVPEDVARIEPLDVPEGLVVSPGITAWRQTSYRADVAHAARVWPHHNDTGGFFVARLRRL